MMLQNLIKIAERTHERAKRNASARSSSFGWESVYGWLVYASSKLRDLVSLRLTINNIALAFKSVNPAVCICELSMDPMLFICHCLCVRVLFFRDLFCNIPNRQVQVNLALFVDSVIEVVSLMHASCGIHIYLSRNGGIEIWKKYEKMVKIRPKQVE